MADLFRDFEAALAAAKAPPPQPAAPPKPPLLEEELRAKSAVVRKAKAHLEYCFARAPEGEEWLKEAKLAEEQAATAATEAQKAW